MPTPHSPVPVQQADYGIDAPGVVRNLAGFGSLGIGLGLVARVALQSSNPIVSGLLFNWGFWSGLACLLTSGLMVWSSKVGKYREREHLVARLHLQGDERVLDVGCGRGLVLNAVARRLTTGRAVGLDVWQAEDQSGNGAAVTLFNARAEGVADRVEIKTGDMREMPFAEATFEAVVSSLAIHNLYSPDARAQAVREIARVLKPGGRVALLDFQKTAEYAQTLRALGWQEVSVSGLRLGMFPPVRVVSGLKPK